MRWNNVPDHATTREIIRLFEKGLTRRQVSEITGWTENHCFQTWLNCRPGELTPRMKLVKEMGKWM